MSVNTYGMVLSFQYIRFLKQVLRVLVIRKFSPLLLLIGLFLLIRPIQGQEFLRGLSVNMGYGTLVAHRNSMQHMLTGNSFCVDINYALRTTGKKRSHYLYRYPWYGVGVNFMDSGNPTHIGKVGGIYGYGKLPITKNKQPLFIKMGLGLGIVQYTFDLQTNYQAIAIGSRVNCDILFRFEKAIHITFNDQTAHLLNFGLGATHFSNAAFQTPNLGLNFIHLYAGYQLEGKHFEPLLPDHLTKEVDHSYEVSLVGGFGLKENAQPLQGKKLILQGKLQIEKHFSFKHSSYISADFLYNESLLTYGNNRFQNGIFWGYFLNFDRIRIGTGLGIHLINRSFSDQPLYHKVIVEYRFSTKLAFQLAMRTHWATADFAAINLRYSILKK
jgi:hypothetical protein